MLDELKQTEQYCKLLDPKAGTMDQHYSKLSNRFNWDYAIRNNLWNRTYHGWLAHCNQLSDGNDGKYD
jgi:hypothetical protein